MKPTDAFWYRYISFDPLKVGSARIVKNTIFGMGVDPDSARFVVWFTNSNERVFVEFDDIQKLDMASRPYKGKINGEEVPQGVTAKSLLQEQGYATANLGYRDTSARTPKPAAKEKTAEVPDQRPVDVLREILKDYPYVYGLTLRPYSADLVIDEPHIFLTQGEWYSLGNDHEDKYCRHGVVCYAKRLGVDDAKAFDMFPLTTNTLSKSAWDEEVEGWLSSIVNELEIRILEQSGGSLTSNTIQNYTSDWMRSKMMGIKHDLARNHPQWVASPDDGQSKWDRMQKALGEIRVGDIEAWLMELADPIADPEVVQSALKVLLEHVQREDPNMTEESLGEWLEIYKSPSRRLRACKLHPYYEPSKRGGVDHDTAWADYDKLEAACWEIKLDDIEKGLREWMSSRNKADAAKGEEKPTADNQLPNRPVINDWMTPFPVEIRMTNSVIDTSGGAVRPCTDQRIIELMNEIVPRLGNKIPMKLGYLVWGIGSSTSMITYLGKAKQILCICPAQIEKIYGRCDVDTLGSAITHEMAHYVMHQIMKNSDIMKFKRQAAGINLHSSQNNASGSPYPFYHEQFAMLAEYGVWGTCARGLQSTKGWDIVSKYFNISQHITPEVIKKYQR